ncbi:MAG: amino acid--tRNA ligase-related protein, partial [Planctomycetota bacterium]|nr:amino acid--tRNA ligase-related protein [Planctomycetota bacterium]
MIDQNRIEILKARSDLLRDVRSFFLEQGFIEVQTPVLSKDTMVDQTIDPIKVQLSGIDRDLFLQTSPEFSMKRLLLEGVSPIFEITPVFRDAEKGKHHNPEFTMLEWYRLGDDYQQGMQLLSEFFQLFFPDRAVNFFSYRQAFESELGINPHTASCSELESYCKRKGLLIPSGYSNSDSLLQLLMAEIVEPSLGNQSICILFDWPESQSALAQLREVTEKSVTYRVSERFEVYIDGKEIANG